MTNTPEDPTWPNWLAAIYGPGELGRSRRAEALRKDTEHKREVEARLDSRYGQGPLCSDKPQYPTAADFGVTAREYTPEEMAKARAELVDHGMPPDPEDELPPPGHIGDILPEVLAAIASGHGCGGHHERGPRSEHAPTEPALAAE